MTTQRLADLPLDAWPSELGFVPFVGDRYEEGIDGCRVLLLAESHYASNAESDDDRRAFTRKFIADRSQPSRDPGESAFLQVLDRLLIAQGEIDPVAASEMWKRIAFANLVQEFVGDTPAHRPRRRHFVSGTAAFKKAIDILQPDVVLVLGRATWDGLDAGTKDARFSAFDARRSLRTRPRDVWTLAHSNRRALMTWVYHPARRNDSWRNMAEALRWLIELAKRDNRVEAGA